MTHMSAARPPEGAKAPSGGSEDTPVPSVGARLVPAATGLKPALRQPC